VVFWVGEGLEVFLADTIDALAADAVSVELGESEGIELLPVREGGTWESNEHADEDEDHDAAAQDDDGHEDAHDDHARVDHEHDHGAYNPHVWLDPQNAAAMVDVIVAVAALGTDHPGRARGHVKNVSALLAADLYFGCCVGHVATKKVKMIVT